MSKSYERKTKCIIRKKVEGLRKDILLISKLIPIEQIFNFDNLPFQQENRFYENNTINQDEQHGITKFRNETSDNSNATDFSSSENSENITSIQSICYNNDKIITNPKQTIMISQVARPRFELGSKAPKASMLGHYTRHLKILPGFRAFLYCMYACY